MIKNLNIDENLEKYISKNSYDLHTVQQDIITCNNNMGKIKKMQISITQAYFMQLLIKINRFKNILEIGTFTGYSALSMALAASDDSLITCIDKNKKTSEIAKNFFKKAKIDKKINLIIGNAIDQLNVLIDKKKVFDFIFIDADKENYINYYEMSYKLLKPNGLILIDNVLWKGDVADKNKNDRMTKILRGFNAYLKKDKNIEKFILPLGDGITICKKKV